MSYVFRDTFTEVRHGIPQTVRHVDSITDAEAGFWAARGCVNTCQSRIFTNGEPWGWDIAEVVLGDHIDVKLPYSGRVRTYLFEKE